MARANATCQECGETKSLFGTNVKEALRKVEWWERTVKLCSNCEASQRYKEDLERSKELDLPDLEGTEAQIKLAVPTRVNMVLSLIEQSDPDNFDKDLTADAAMVLDHAAKKTDASWWLDNRHHSIEHLIRRVAAGIRKLHAPENDPALLDLVNLEATIRPEEARSELVAEIRMGEGVFNISFPERDDDFNGILKLYGARWNANDKTWDFDPNGHPVAHLAAEVGAHLIAEEFVVRVLDEEVRGLIQSGDFQKSDGRKIDWYGAEKVRVDWRRIDGDYYDEVKGIKGATWDKPLQTILIPITMADEIRDFASVYGFTITERGASAFEQFDDYRRSGMIAAGKKRAKGKAERIIDESKLPTGTIDPDLLDA